MSPRPGDTWWCTNGAINIVLFQGSGTAQTLELECDDLEQEVTRMLSLDGVTADVRGTYSVGRRRECALHCADGFHLVLFQRLDEDDLDELPVLPASLPWEDSADLLTRQLLRAVPVWIRDKARSRVTHEAEYLAVDAGALVVAEPHAMTAFVACTLPSGRETLYAEMERLGVCATPYVAVEEK